MKRSKTVELTVLAQTLVVLAACSGPNAATPPKNYQQCVDQNKVVVSDAQCNQPRAAGGMGMYPYYWLYSSRPYTSGMTVTDGFTTPRANLGAPVRSSGLATTARSGGFGSTGAGASGLS